MAKRKDKAVVEKVDLSRKKTKEFDVDTNLKVVYKTGKIIFGKNRVLKNLKRENPFKMLIVSNNCPTELMNQLNHYMLYKHIHCHR